MPSPAQNERQLSRIIVYGFALAFGLVVASLEALKPAPAGFAIELSWRTLLAFVVGTLIVLPCFQVIVYSARKSLRRSALALIIVLGLGAFFYPMRVVPADKWRAVFTGLAVAILALSVMATLLLLLHRFFEREEKERQG